MTETARLPMLTNASAWRLLPGAPAEMEELPAWREGSLACCR